MNPQSRPNSGRGGAQSKLSGTHDPSTYNSLLVIVSRLLYFTERGVFISTIPYFSWIIYCTITKRTER